MSDTNGDRNGPDPQAGTEPVASPTPSTSVTSATRRSRLVAPVAAVAAVAVVAVGGTVLVSRGGPDDHAGSPPVLRLVNRADAGSAEAAHVGGTVVAQSRPVVTGTLPSGPDGARVRTFGAGRAPQDRVVALARALGLPGDPARQDDGWRVRDGERLLTVSDTPGWRWTLSTVARAVPLPKLPPRSAPPASPASPEPPARIPDPLPPQRTTPPPGSGGGKMACLVIVNGRRVCPPVPLSPQGGTLAPGVSIPEKPAETSGEGSSSSVSSGSSSSSVSAGTSSADPQQPVPSPDPAVLRKAARPVLTGLGLGTAEVTVSTLPGEGLVTADPMVDGMPTRGYSTVLGFDRTRLTFGTGWLATPRAGARYPLASARDVLDRMPVAECDGCGASDRPTTVTGARLGLALNMNDRGDPLLVPAWFYRVRGRDVALVLVAVEPAFLGGPRGTSGPAGQPGVVEPAAPAGGAVPAVPAVPDDPAPHATR